MSDDARLGILLGDRLAWFKVVSIAPGWSDATKTLTLAGEGRDILEPGEVDAILADGDSRTAGTFAASRADQVGEHMHYAGTWRATPGGSVHSLAEGENVST